jgi:hypothetical protein
MALMNHTNLTTYNVPALTDFFCLVFGFHVMEKRANKIACSEELRELSADTNVR